MLNWIKGRQSDHPLAEDKAARELIAELPANDSFKSLEELCYWLDSLKGAQGLKLGRQFEIIDLIDEAAKNHQRKLSQDYLSGSARLQKFQEIRIWNTSFSFWKQLADAYQLWLTRYQDDAAGRGALKGPLSTIVARAMRALSLQLKWQLLRYGPVAPRLWKEYGKLFAHAEEKGFVATKVEVYPGKFGASTVQREFLKGLMLAISSTDSLLPMKLEVAERVVAQFSEFFVLSRQPAKGCHYYIDLTTGMGPARMVSRLQMTEGMRFFGPGSAAEELEKLIIVLQTDGVVPSNVNLGGVFGPELVLEVLRHLGRYWAPVPPARGEERHRSVSRISVIHTFDDILATVSRDTENMAFDNSAETWTVENESAGGYGALLPQTKGDWLKVGTLLGVKLERGAAWGVGIVRRLSAYDLKQRYVGIQVFSKGATAVKIAPANAGNSANAEDAMLLPSSTSDSTGTGEMSLLLRPGVFSKKKTYEMQAYDRSYLLVPKKLLEGGDDFDMARFRVMQRSA
ncbi:MAG TPA: hypothetical protein VGR01_17275 [Burkholderiales bacterium]|jgi:hypothetical protein|nr:hypothetical protein [Burkholderiales bacterium]